MGFLFLNSIHFLLQFLFHFAIKWLSLGFPVRLHPSPASVVPDESHDALHDEEHHEGQQNEADYVG